MHPTQIVHKGKIFTFVTTFVAGYFAQELFESVGITAKDYFICKRSYVTADDMKSAWG